MKIIYCFTCPLRNTVPHLQPHPRKNPLHKLPPRGDFSFKINDFTSNSSELSKSTYSLSFAVNHLFVVNYSNSLQEKAIHYQALAIQFFGKETE